MAAGPWAFVRITPRVVLIALFSFDRQRISTPTGIPTPFRSASITIPNRIDKIDSEHSLDASDFPRLSSGP
jgi:hypothetical protein